VSRASNKQPTANSTASPAQTTIEARDAARDAGLRYVTDAEPGMSRQRAGRGFRYVAADGASIRDKDELARIKRLVIPPAWTDVWICSSPRGHLQATGRDAAGRKQYRYHARWRETRDETKYSRMIDFGHALPVIRQRVDVDLAGRALTREKVLAAVVSLLEQTMIRVGNEEYARANHSYGLTTLRDRHVALDGGTIRFHFRGKSGKEHEVNLQDHRLARIVKRCRELPGQTLFQYVDEDGTRHSIGSADVNDYLHQIAGDAFTAKDFRTWAGTLLTCQALICAEPSATKAEAQQQIVRVIDEVADQLGNTRAVCRRCYVHPAVLDAYLDGTLHTSFSPNGAHGSNGARPRLTDDERALLKLLEGVTAANGAGG
jgi:DNA topoisomerase-1